MKQAGKLKEALDTTRAAGITKANLESQVKRLKVELAANGKEIAALKESVQKAADELIGLCTSLNSKNGELQALASTRSKLQG